MYPTHSQKLHHYEWLDKRTVEFDRGDISLRLTFLESSLLRCHYVRGQIFDEIPSYGVDAHYRSKFPVLTEIEDEHAVNICSKTLCVRVRRADMGLEFYDRATGCLLSADAEGMGHRAQEAVGDDIVWMLKHMPEKACFLGLGDKPTDLNLRGKRLELWNCDHYSFKEHGDPLYKSIPFFLCIQEQGSHGIFFDNSMRSYFDFGKTDKKRLLFGADGGQMDYYFIGGNSALDIVAAYTRLTGLPAMPPLWALGYHQSRWGYKQQQKVIELAESFRTKHIPCDSIHLDIDHMEQRQSLTWNKENFPDPEQMIEGLEDLGIKCVTIVNPSIKIDMDQYIWRSGFEHNVYCRRHDGALMEGEAWAGMCHFPDFSSPRVRGWWARLFIHDIKERGVRGIWADMNEPSLSNNKSFPNDTRHDFEGHPCSHNKAHNIYGQAMLIACRDAMLLHAPRRRPFVLSRAGYAGLQRYAATWTGDNVASWPHLRLANLMVQRLSTSGISFAGSDTGGFLQQPSAELFYRWMQLSAFHPFLRAHCHDLYGSREPWSFGAKAEQHCRHAIEQRYRLLPYFYTLFYRYATTGLPMIRSLALQYGDLRYAQSDYRCFFLGDALYVIAVQWMGEKSCNIHLPSGTWYKLWTDECCGTGKCDYSIDITAEHIPVLVRAGCVIPRWPIQQYVGEIAHPRVSYELWWLDDGEQESHHYEDSGDGYDYQQGDYLDHHFHYRCEQGKMVLQHDWSGNVRLAGQEEVDLLIHGLPSLRQLDILMDDTHTRSVQIDEDGVLRLTLPRFFQQVDLHLLAS